ncbi:hypothetical protein XA68_11115 [Ophiocordyceps unilateralis]|uniref:Uncharacterized protein n=1 Tax=Ophiocordyceps unilateralis TaxID=268505 RepID=A0A2A9PG71_OPHUN|nr:hypothetical protein XA68_11115 [Ophiocordyceps unilateralis]
MAAPFGSKCPFCLDSQTSCPLDSASALFSAYKTRRGREKEAFSPACRKYSALTQPLIPSHPIISLTKSTTTVSRRRDGKRSQGATEARAQPKGWQDRQVAAQSQRKGQEHPMSDLQGDLPPDHQDASVIGACFQQTLQRPD